MKYKSYRILPHFMGGMECSIYDIDRHLKHHDFGEAHQLFPLQKPIGNKFSYLNFIDPEPGKPFKVSSEDPDGKLWKKQIKDLVKRGHYFKFWGSFAMEYSPETQYDFIACQFDPEEHRWLLEHAGKYFLGYELGEYDGLYQRDSLPLAQPRPLNRLQAYKHWWDYQKKLKARLHDYVVATCALTFPHYYGEMGASMLGQEMGQGLLSHQLAGSFLRGAAKQYALDYGVAVSGFDRWGAREYAGESFSDSYNWSPYVGHSPDFQIRTWYLCWLYGASFVQLEMGHYAKEVIDGIRQLSPIGTAYEKFCKWSRNAGPIPEIYCPIAVILDYYNGWLPPHQLYSKRTNRVWGDIPYNKGDYTINALFDFFYPGYDQASSYRDERGFMVPTPLGDCIEVFLTNTKIEPLKDFPVAVLLGYTDIDRSQADILGTYVETGNTLVLSTANLSKSLSERLSISTGEEGRIAFYSFWKENGYEFREEKYLYREPIGEGRTIQSSSEDGVCTIAEFKRGNGRVICIGAEHGATDILQEGFYDTGPLDQPYELLNVVKFLLGELAEELSVFQIEGEPIHWVTNGDGGSGTLIGLFNHTDRNWQGKVSNKTSQSGLRDYLYNQILESIGEKCQIDVPAHGFRILQVI